MCESSNTNQDRKPHSEVSDKVCPYCKKGKLWVVKQNSRKIFYICRGYCRSVFIEQEDSDELYKVDFD